MDRLQAMKVFCRVVDRQGFAAAARELDLSPSVVTRLVNELEAHLGVRLMNRTTRTLTLTAAGERYVDQARRLLQDLDDIESEAASATTDLSGRLRVQVPPALPHIKSPGCCRHSRPATRASASSWSLPM